MQETERDDSEYFQSFFQEYDLFELKLKDLDKIQYQDVDALSAILEKYQEQPHLLDPHLEYLIQKCVSYLKKHFLSSQLQQELCSVDVAKMTLSVFRLLYVFVKVRGSKVVMRFFSNSFEDLESVVHQLSMLAVHDSDLWEMRYILLLWLSLLVRLPFDLSAIPFNDSHNISSMISEVAKRYLSSPAIERDAAALVIAYLVVRNDESAKTSELPCYLRWSFNTLVSSLERFILCGENTSLYSSIGILSCLVNVLKLAQEASRMDIANDFMDLFRKIKTFTENTTIWKNSLLMKLYMKLARHILVSYFPPLKNSIISGSRILNSSQMDCYIDNIDTKETENVLFHHLPLNFNEVLEFLFTAVAHDDYRVRWSGAKGIARCLQFAESSVLSQYLSRILNDLNTPMNDEYRQSVTWQGNLLLLAELARKQLLADAQISLLLPVLKQGLLYDVKFRAWSLGANVRDAACYLAWSLARKTKFSDISPIKSTLLQLLIINSLFDREINGRRAAAAALQELIGRQGLAWIPYGIDLITLIEYYSVGLRSRAYVDVAPKVFQRVVEHRRALTEHLLHVKLIHWDVEIRQLASQSLYQFALMADEKSLLDDIRCTLSMALSPIDPMVCHGALLGSAWLIRAATTLRYSWSHSDISSDVSRLITTHSIKYDDLCRTALCELITSLCEGTLPIEQTLVQLMKEFLAMSIFSAAEQEDTVKAIVKTMGIIHRRWYDADDLILVDRLVQQSVSDHPHRYASAYALSSFPVTVLHTKKDAIFSALFKAASPCSLTKPSMNALNGQRFNPQQQPMHAVLLKKYALLALSSILRELWGVLSTDEKNRSYGVIVDGLNDYSIGQQGDIGSWVRMSSMEGLCLLHMSLTKECADVDEQLIVRALAGVLCQCCDKLDKLRVCGKEYLGTLLRHLSWLKDYPLLSATLFRENTKDVVEMDNEYASVMPLLISDAFRYAILSGVLSSMAGMSKSGSEKARLAFINYLHEHLEESLLTKLNSDLLAMSKVSRLVVPALKGFMMMLEEFPHAWKKIELEKWYPLLDKFVETTKDLQRLRVIGEILCLLLTCEDRCIKQGAWRRLMGLSRHSFPSVRRDSCEQIYSTLLLNENLVKEDVSMDEVLLTLRQTDWCAPPQETDPVRQYLETVVTFVEMVCQDCEKKLTKLAVPDKWKDKSKGGSLGAITSKATISKIPTKAKTPTLGSKCRLCKQTVQGQNSIYCGTCAYKKGICAMCGKKIMDTKGYRQTVA